MLADDSKASSKTYRSCSVPRAVHCKNSASTCCVLENRVFLEQLINVRYLNKTGNVRKT
jgi:hypothetical protein